MNNDRQQARAAAEFAGRWAGRGYEKGESQKFWLELLGDVLGVEHPTAFIEFEDQVLIDSTSFIDGYIPATRVMIEQKSLGKDLRKPIRQSDGAMLTPFQQAKRYVSGLPLSRHPRWVVVSNFERFLVYDMERPNVEPQEILLSDLGREYYRLQFLVNTQSEHLSRELQVSMQAGQIIGEVYDALLAQYGDSDAETLRLLNVLCVRLVFCLYAEDAGIFGRDQFHDYLAMHNAGMMRDALLQLFETLNTPPEQRSRFLRDELRAFPYTNGGLFAEPIDIPQFTPELAGLLLKNASLDFDWSEISPTIFGAVFESTLNPETRRTGGMHYTSIENIHKVIDPLLMDDLYDEFHEICQEGSPRTRRTRLLAFQDRLASLTFLDPACGSGNFLTETYLSLRRLENQVVTELTGGRAVIGFDDVTPIKVSINQFHGIEINDFAVTVATTALWISEAQMLRETERIVRHDIDFLPLRSYANIREGNALRIDWELIDVPDDTVTIHAVDTYLSMSTEPSADVASEPVIHYGSLNLTTANILPGPKPAPQPRRVHYDYIIGNPPFVGARQMTPAQKQDMIDIFGAKWKNVGNMDYVCCWYKKASQLMKSSPRTRVAFVSTNSICQGEQVASLWQPLMSDGIQINFAHRTFRWDSESAQKAHVHCVVVGFGCEDVAVKTIYDGDEKTHAAHINAYLADAPDVFIVKRAAPLSDVPPMNYGSFALDDGNFTISKEEYEKLVSADADLAQLLRPFIGAQEMLHGIERYCIWLKDVPLLAYAHKPVIRQKVAQVKQWRAASKRRSTALLAQSPTLFAEVRQPSATYLAVPTICSEKRSYIPMMFLAPDVIASNQLYVVPDATLYHFGVMQSSVHMAWMRAVCGRLKSDYRYSSSIVYNNFPWPEASEQQRAKIEQTAQAILDARALHGGVPLADLYDEVMMPVELRKAHQLNDRAVMEAYGMPWRTTTEAQCVAQLLALYQQISGGDMINQ